MNLFVDKAIDKRLSDPIGYMRCHAEGYRRLRAEYDPEDVPELGLTEELLGYFEAGDTRAIEDFHKRNAAIGEDLGTQFYCILSFLEEYLDHVADGA
jgi:hypothetical protein